MYTQTKIKMGCQKMLDNIQQVLAFKEVSIPFFWGGGWGVGHVAYRNFSSLTGDQTHAQYWKHGVLTTGPPGNPQKLVF